MESHGYSPDILVVEDDPHVVALMRSWLEPSGFRVRDVDEERLAMASIQSRQPDVVVVDLKLRIGSGFDLMRALRGHGLDIPVVVFSASNNATDGFAAHALGALEFVHKPSSRSEFTGVVERAALRARGVVSGTLADLIASSRDRLRLPVQRALAIIERQYLDKDLGVAVLGNRVGLSADHLSDIFYRDTGVTILECIHFLRTDHAARLLQRSQLSIKEIADLSGYQSVRLLERHFNQRWGCTPTSFRESRRH